MRVCVGLWLVAWLVGFGCVVWVPLFESCVLVVSSDLWLDVFLVGWRLCLLLFVICWCLLLLYCIVLCRLLLAVGCCLY